MIFKIKVGYDISTTNLKDSIRILLIQGEFDILSERFYATVHITINLIYDVN